VAERFDPDGAPKRRAKKCEVRCGECARFLRGGKWCSRYAQRADCFGCYHTALGRDDVDWKPGEPLFRGCDGPAWTRGQCVPEGPMRDETLLCRADDFAGECKWFGKKEADRGND